jgi:AAA15 family ATPase/GTPase
MRINTFKFHDTTHDWKLEKTDFKDLTLLVGASGVGKTLILKSILTMKQIAGGEYENNSQWVLEFETTNNLKYKWEGSYENAELERNSISRLIIKSKDENEPIIKYERVFLNGKQIVDRTTEKIIFNDVETPKLSQQESIISLLKEEADISPAYNGFKKILTQDTVDFSNPGLAFRVFDHPKLLMKYKTLESIQGSKVHILDKLYLVSKNVPEVFARIKVLFSSFFPQVEDIKVEPLELDDSSPEFLKEQPFLKIKEKGVKNLITHSYISSGMYKTLFHIGQLFLVPEGTVILIDEFENSLGINCIDELTEELLSSGRKLQFIITSHHPYIINNIDFKHWKLVTRKAGMVKTLDADSLNLGKSKHDAFIQLINLDQYKHGIDAEPE